MRYTKKGTVYVATRITGPTHNLLGLEFRGPEMAAVGVEVENLKDVPTGSVKISIDQIRDWVISALAAANQLCGTSFYITRIQYVADDTPNPSSYGMLVAAILDRIHRHPDHYDGQDW